MVQRYAKVFVDEGLSVTVNFVGLSRGGIGGLYLAQELACFSATEVLLNLLLFDPVPGNFIWISRFLDWAGYSNANQSMDVSSVRNMGRVLVLYPHVPLPSIAVHAPILPRFPDGCKLEEEVLLGCHQGALWLRPKADTCLAFARIRDFLLECGSLLDLNRHLVRDLDVEDARLAELLDGELHINAPTTRSAHAWLTGRQVVRRATRQFVNKYHQALLQKLGRPHQAEPPGAAVYLLDFEPPQPFFSS